MFKCFLSAKITKNLQASRKPSDVLKDKTVQFTFHVIKNLKWNGIQAVIVRCVVKGEIMGTHVEKAFMSVPQGLSINNVVE